MSAAEPTAEVEASPDGNSLIDHVRVADLTPVANEAQARRMGFEPCYHFATWECLRP